MFLCPGCLRLMVVVLSQHLDTDSSPLEPLVPVADGQSESEDPEYVDLQTGPAPF